MWRGLGVVTFAAVLTVSGCATTRSPETTGCFTGLEPAIQRAAGQIYGHVRQESARRDTLPPGREPLGDRLACWVGFSREDNVPPANNSPYHGLNTPDFLIAVDYCSYRDPLPGFGAPTPAAEETCGFPTSRIPASGAWPPVRQPGIGAKSGSWAGGAVVSRGPSYPTGTTVFLHGQTAVLVSIRTAPGDSQAPDLRTATETLARAVAQRLDSAGLPSPSTSR